MLGPYIQVTDENSEKVILVMCQGRVLNMPQNGEEGWSLGGYLREIGGPTRKNKMIFGFFLEDQGVYSKNMIHVQLQCTLAWFRGHIISWLCTQAFPQAFFTAVAQSMGMRLYYIAWECGLYTPSIGPTTCIVRFCNIEMSITIMHNDLVRISSPQGGITLFVPF